MRARANADGPNPQLKIAPSPPENISPNVGERAEPKVFAYGFFLLVSSSEKVWPGSNNGNNVLVFDFAIWIEF